MLKNLTKKLFNVYIKYKRSPELTHKIEQIKKIDTRKTLNIDPKDFDILINTVETRQYIHFVYSCNFCVSNGMKKKEAGDILLGISDRCLKDESSSIFNNQLFNFLSGFIMAGSIEMYIISDNSIVQSCSIIGFFSTFMLSEISSNINHIMNIRKYHGDLTHDLIKNIENIGYWNIYMEKEPLWIT